MKIGEPYPKEGAVSFKGTAPSTSGYQLSHRHALRQIPRLAGVAGSARILRTMERLGLVHFEQGENRQLAPRVDDSGVAFEMSF